MNDLLRGRPLDDVVDSLPELWESCLRVRDDIKESVRNAAELACKTLSRVSTVKILKLGASEIITVNVLKWKFFLMLQCSNIHPKNQMEWKQCRP